MFKVRPLTMVLKPNLSRAALVSDGNLKFRMFRRLTVVFQEREREEKRRQSDAWTRRHRRFLLLACTALASSDRSISGVPRIYPPPSVPRAHWSRAGHVIAKHGVNGWLRVRASHSFVALVRFVARARAYIVHCVNGRSRLVFTVVCVRCSLCLPARARSHRRPVVFFFFPIPSTISSSSSPQRFFPARTAHISLSTVAPYAPRSISRNDPSSYGFD